MERRPFWVYAVYDLRRWWPVLILPLLRLISPERPLAAGWAEYGISAGLIAYSVLKWRCARYRVSKSQSGRFHGIGVRQGIACRHSLHVAAEDAASVEIERTPLLSLCGGRRVRVSTAGLRRRADAVLYLPARQVRELFALQGQQRRRYRAKLWPVLVMAVTGSNAAVGLLTAVPALRQIGRLIGERLTPDAETLLHAELPVLFRTAANFLMLGWGVAALNNFLRYVGFYAMVEERHLHLVSGLFTRRDVLIDRDKITGVELRQTLFMRLCGLYTAVITAAGYGRDVGARPVLIPAADPRTLSHHLQRLLPEFPIKSGRIRPMAGARFRYVGPPALLLAGGILLWLGGGFYRVPSLLVMTVAIWWGAVRLMGFHAAGFGADATAVTVWYPRGLALYRVYLPREVVDDIRLSQSPWQRRRGSCTVTVRCFGEKKRRHRVRGLPYDAVRYEIDRQ